MILGIIYRYVNLINGKAYTGWTTNFDQRQKAHKRMDRTAPAFHDAIEVYGFDNFRCDIMEHNATKARECFWIATFGDFGNGYNLTEGGEGTGSGENSPMFGKGHLIAGEKHGMFGKGHLIAGEKHGMFGQKHKPETIAKISEALRGEKHWTHGRTGEHHPLFGRKRKPETIAKISKSMKGEKNSMFGKSGGNSPTARPEYAQARVYFFLCIAPMEVGIKGKRQHFCKAFKHIPKCTLNKWFRKWQLELEIK